MRQRGRWRAVKLFSCGGSWGQTTTCDWRIASMGVLAEAKMRVQMTGLNEPRMPIQAECSVSVNARLASRNLLGARWCCRSCSPMDPMDVLKYHQHRPAPRRSFAREFGSSRLSTRLEELLAFALRAEVERAAGSDRRPGAAVAGAARDHLSSSKTGTSQPPWIRGAS